MAASTVYWRLAREEISKFVRMLEAIQISLNSETRKMDVANNSSGNAPVPCIPCALPDSCRISVVDDRAPFHNHPRINFPFKVSWLLLFDVVGRRQRSPSYPPSLPRRNSPAFASRWTIILFRFPRTDCTAIQNAHLPRSLVYLLELGSYRTYDGRSLSPDPLHHSFSNRTHTFVFVRFFPNFCTLLSYGLPLSCQ